MGYEIVYIFGWVEMVACGRWIFVVETRTGYGSLRIDELEIASPVGGEMLKERSVLVRAGERVLIVGAPGTSKTLLFRSLAGLWPWGSGTVTRPKDIVVLGAVRAKARPADLQGVDE